MTVRIDESGRRAITVEAEVPGTPEAVWSAVATGPGISSWFVPTTIETDENGTPRSIRSDFGPGMESLATVHTWDPPRSFTCDSADLGPDAPAVATRWSVEPRSGDACLVRVEHAIPTDSDRWDGALRAWESGWPDFFRLLRLYLMHFAGRPGASIALSATTAESTRSAWSTLARGLGLEDFPPDGRLVATDGAPSLAGRVEQRGKPGHAEELLLLLDEPAPGIAHLFTMGMGGKTFVSIRLHLFGPDADEIAARQQPAWQSWIGRIFPSS